VAPPACDPPHSRFHPVPARPVFENGVIGPVLFESPFASPVDPHNPSELPPPAPADDEPQLLPEISSKPIGFERPSSRRRR
jgi:hypothetical protein